MFTEMDHVLLPSENINMTQVHSELSQYCLLSIVLQLLVLPSTSSMNTCKKNKSAHPGIPDMTPSQLASAGLSHTPKTHRLSNKKLTKDQQIAALKDEIQAVRELILSGNSNGGGWLSSQTKRESSTSRCSSVDNLLSQDH